MLLRNTIGLCLFVVAACVCTRTWADNPVTWQVSLYTEGEDASWTSPTSLTPGLPKYDWSYEITRLTAVESFFGGQDLRGGLGASASGSGTGTDLPLVFVDQMLNEPSTGTSAILDLGIDASGVGRASATDITLGTVFGLPITRIELEATISVIGVPTGDYNRDGSVESADYELWRSSFGSTEELGADGNDDGVVDSADYTIWRDALGAGAGGGRFAVSPEPSSIDIALVGILMLSACALGQFCETLGIC